MHAAHGAAEGCAAAGARGAQGRARHSRPQLVRHAGTPDHRRGPVPIFYFAPLFSTRPALMQLLSAKGVGQCGYVLSRDEC